MNEEFVCKSCGDCCELMFPLCHIKCLDDVNKEFYSVRYGGLYHGQESDLIYINMGPCEKFDKITRKCTIYENRPKMCKDNLCHNYKEKIIKLS